MLSGRALRQDTPGQATPGELERQASVTLWLVLIDPQKFPATFSDLALLPADTERLSNALGMVAVRCRSRPDYADAHAVYVPGNHSGPLLDHSAQLWADLMGQDNFTVPLRIVREGKEELLGAFEDPDWQRTRRWVLQQQLGPADVPPDTSSVRRCTSLQDWEALLALYLQTYPGTAADFTTWRVEQLRRRVAAGQGEVWAFWSEGRALATAGGFRLSGLFRFQEVMCHPAFRRRGYALRVCRHVAAQARELTATVVAEGRAARALYAKAGFRAVGVQELLIAS